MVRRTNQVETGETGDANTLGDSELFWSPDGRNLSFSIFVHRDSGGVEQDDCHIFYVPSDPKDGNTPTHFSFPPLDQHDYDPSWSPLGTEIAFDRADNRIFIKGIPGINPDTTLRLVAFGDVGDLNRGAATPAISPDGLWVAYTLKDQRGDFGVGWSDLWKVLLADTTQRVRLTQDLNAAFPQWSPDGEWIYFDNSPNFEHLAYRVRTNHGPAPPIDAVLVPGAPGDSVHAKLPSPSPDSLVVVVGRGGFEVLTTTIDPLLAETQDSIPSFPEYFDSTLTILTLSPRLSPDGTRLAVHARIPGSPEKLPQLWAARRNMSLPPVITDLGSKEIGEDTVVVHFDIQKSHLLTLELESSDPEGDDIDCSAFFMRDDLDMEFSESTCTFTWRPKIGQVDSTFTVKFQVTTPSGGVDVVLAQITVTGTGGGGNDDRAAIQGIPGLQNPSRGTFALATPLMPGVTAKLKVYNVAGRLMAEVEGKAGSYLVWDGKRSSGIRVPSGVYLYRLEVGAIQKRGKFVLIR
jgi:dipeptidyl aminopeptidase/acylaminoacyl peptidase